MGVGADLLQMQQIDLAVVRERQSLSEMPELRELAKKRTSRAKLKAEAVKLMAQRKDVETELAELDEEERVCTEGVAAAQARPVDRSDYRQVQDLQEELANFAKRLDKAAFSRGEVRERLAEAREREDKLAAYIKRFEDSIVADTRAARERAAGVQARIDEMLAERERLARRIPADVLATYDAASKRFDGLAVEQLEGRVPSVCRTTLQPASLDVLQHGGEVSECPYCHRMIVCGVEARS